MESETIRLTLYRGAYDAWYPKNLPYEAFICSALQHRWFYIPREICVIDAVVTDKPVNGAVEFVLESLLPRFQNYLYYNLSNTSKRKNRLWGWAEY